MVLVIQNARDRSLQPRIGPIAACTDVIREPLRVTAEIELIVGAVPGPVAEEQMPLVAALEAGARDDVECGVGSVAILSGKTSPLHLDGLDVLGIELWADVAGDVRVRHGHAINHPLDL